MPNLSVNISGYSDIVADSITVSGNAVVGGRTTSAGFTSSIQGTAGTPAYKLTANNGMYEDGTSRTAIATAGVDKAYWSTTTNHNYQLIQGAAGINMTGGDIVDNAGTVSAAYISASAQIASPLVYIAESTAPGALANYSILYSLDVAGKTQLNTKQGAAGTVQQLAIEV